MLNRNSTIETILCRRSISALQDPGPSSEQLNAILQSAATVPDHGSLRPFRLVVVGSEHKQSFSEALVASALEVQGGLEDHKRKKIAQKAYMAPLQVLLIFSPQEHPKIPEWEQFASASCAGYAMTLASHALDLGAVWKSFAFESGKDLSKLLNLKTSEKLLGWINIGTKAVNLNHRDLPAVQSYTSFLS